MSGQQDSFDRTHIKRAFATSAWGGAFACASNALAWVSDNEYPSLAVESVCRS